MPLTDTKICNAKASGVTKRHTACLGGTVEVS